MTWWISFLRQSHDDVGFRFVFLFVRFGFVFYRLDSFRVAVIEMFVDGGALFLRAVYFYIGSAHQ